MPRTFGGRCILPQDVEIAVVRAEVEAIMGAIPLVENFLDHVLLAG